jgi:hypothetical protein
MTVYALNANPAKHVLEFMHFENGSGPEGALTVKAPKYNVSIEYNPAQLSPVLAYCAGEIKSHPKEHQGYLAFKAEHCSGNENVASWLSTSRELFVSRLERYATGLAPFLIYTFDQLFPLQQTTKPAADSISESGQLYRAIESFIGRQKQQQ